MPTPYHELYLKGIELFNEEDFFESHEIWEELWSETQDERKKFYQGLIQVSVALLHFGNENFGGAKKVYESSCKYLRAYEPEFEGINVTQLLADMKHCFQELLDCPESYPTSVFLRDERIPKIPPVD
jgi:predicted metal-dependent hydrolase